MLKGVGERLLWEGYVLQVPIQERPNWVKGWSFVSKRVYRVVEETAVNPDPVMNYYETMGKNKMKEWCLTRNLKMK